MDGRIPEFVESERIHFSVVFGQLNTKAKSKANGTGEAKNRALLELLTLKILEWN